MDLNLQKYTDGRLSRAERLELLLPPLEEASELLMACPPADYCASAIARAVEDCNAQLLSLSVTGMRDDAGRPVLSLRVNVRNPEGVARSLRRYGYDPFYEAGANGADTPSRRRARERAAELIRYLDI